MQEKRHHSRHSVSLQVTVVFRGSPEQVTCICRNLSLGGVFVFTDKRPAFGAQAEVTIQFPESARIHAYPAIVRWTAPDGVGLQFGSLGVRETAALSDYLVETRDSE